MAIISGFQRFHVLKLPRLLQLILHRWQAFDDGCLKLCVRQDPCPWGAQEESKITTAGEGGQKKLPLNDRLQPHLSKLVVAFAVSLVNLHMYSRN